MADTTTSPKRRKRADLKQLVLMAGIEVLERDGLGFGSEDLTYAKVFEHLEQTQGIRVTRGSVHERIWDSQRDFQLDVLAKIAEWDFVTAIDETRAFIATSVVDADLTSHDRRAGAMRLLLRVAPMENLRQSARGDRWPLWQATVSSVLAHPADDESARVVRTAAAGSYRKLLAAWASLYSDTALMLGYRVRQIPGLSEVEVAEKWTSMILALADGFAIRLGAGLVDAFELPTGDLGQAEAWDDFGFALWQALPAFFENPPD